VYCNILILSVKSLSASIENEDTSISKVTLIKLHELCEHHDGWNLWCTIHDEILVEVPDTITFEETKEIERVMVESYKWGDNVDNKTDLEIMRVWGLGVTPEEWFNL